MSDEGKITGGCLCGAIRYEADEPPFWTGYCHCRMCQRAYGNAFGLFADFRKNVFRFTQGGPKTYKSSAWVERGFCGNCGTPLTFRYLEPLIRSERRLGLIGISLGSLDHPEDVHPTEHGYVDSQLPWLSIEDGLPRSVSDDDVETAEAWAVADKRDE